jgi:exopolysaccharide production protein ExoQ
MPQIATLVTFASIALLFRWDCGRANTVSRAIWIPVLWVLVIAGKSVAIWLEILFGVTNGPVTWDSMVWTVLIVAGALVIRARRVAVSSFILSNRWMSAYLLYSLVSVAWSDVPFTSFKHWLAVLGHPIMALIILTEPNPKEALKAFMRRYGYVVILVSVLLIRYYPQWGRMFDNSSMTFQNAGYAYEKNTLGLNCMILGIFFFWNFLSTRQSGEGASRRNELFVCVGFLALVGLLFKGLNCGTALVSLWGGISCVVLLGRRMVNPRYLGVYIIVGAVLLGSIELAFGVKAYVIQLLNKDPTLTGRTDFWPELVAMTNNPILGTGYESFWEGNRLATLWAKYWWKPTEAHNGYVETYLNLGAVGLVLMFGFLAATYRKIGRRLLIDSDLGRLQLGYLAATMLYNWSEAGYKTLSPVYLMLFIIAVDYPSAVVVAEVGVGAGISTRQPSLIDWSRAHRSPAPAAPLWRSR